MARKQKVKENGKLDRLARAVQKGFEGIDKRFEAIDKRFDDLTTETNYRFDKVDERFNRLIDEMKAGFDRMGDSLVSFRERIERLEEAVFGRPKR